MSLTTIVSAQLKIGYILSERIRTEYEEFKEAESQLQLEYRKVQFEFDQRVKKLDSLKQDYEVKRLMSLDKGETIKQEIVQTEKQIQTYEAEKVGPQGELMKKSAQIEYEILGKVREAVRKDILSIPETHLNWDDQTLFAAKNRDKTKFKRAYIDVKGNKFEQFAAAPNFVGGICQDGSGNLYFCLSLIHISEPTRLLSIS